MKSDSTYHSLYALDDDEKTLAITDDSREQPKVALRKKFSILHPLVHLLPLGATIFVVQLSFRGVYWDDDGGYDIRWQTFLQFPAKLHEILIVGSLSAIVLHIFRRMLVGTHGLPLGLMVGAYQIGSAEYLISKSFVKPFRHSLFHRHYKMFLVALSLGSAIIYSFLVGPASAAAIIPVLAWWDMVSPFNDSLPLTCYIGRGSAEIYPEAFQAEDVNPDCIKTWGYQGCPGEGFDQLNIWMTNWADEARRYNVTEGRSFNPTVLSSFSGRTRREIIAKLVYPGDKLPGAATAVTLHSSVLALTDAFWHFVESGNVGMIPYVQRPKFAISKQTPTKSPLVQVQCTTSDYSELMARHRNDSYILFDTSAMNNFSGSDADGYLKSQWKVPKAAWDFSRPKSTMNATNVDWIDVADIESTRRERLRSSLAAVVTLPELYNTNYPNGTSLAGQGSVVASCLIDGRWAETDVTFDPRREDIVRTSLVDWFDATNLASEEAHVMDGQSRWGLSDAIYMNSSWAATLDSNVGSSNVFFKGLTIVEYLLQHFVKPITNDNNETVLYFRANNDVYDGKTYVESVSENVATVLSAVMADWLSRSTFRDTPFTTVTSAEEDGNVTTVNLLLQASYDSIGTQPVSAFDNQTAVEFKLQRYGWGYGLSSGTVWFSILILLMHAALVVLYFTYSFVFWIRDAGWTSASWGSIGELVALANLSQSATELKNSGAGINRSRTWMTRLRIRERGPDDLELVIGSRGGTVIPDEHMLKINKEYA